MKTIKLSDYQSPNAEILSVGQMYGICQESPAPGSNEGISYEEWGV